ncbi:unnamed protein product [Phyllotreta striolata]|uniref:MI domain-containing protein n=1 Tax=Phyllotreta striolata TaxID=444603 RepID=A0A9N9TY29_PHYSR|nr:unnamed protein product [Phyllotreta striolata]
MAFKNKNAKQAPKLTRKEQRKVKRKDKKVRKNEFFSKKKGDVNVNNNNASVVENEKFGGKAKGKKKEKPVNTGVKEKQPDVIANKVLSSEKLREKEMKEKRKLTNEMKKQRFKQLLEANKEEDKIIQQMEKQLGLKKRKSKSIPKSFTEDGLDFLLEVVDPEYLKNASHQDMEEADNDFEEDFALMSGKPVEQPQKNKTLKRKTDDKPESKSKRQKTSVSDEDYSNSDESFDENNSESDIEDEADDGSASEIDIEDDDNDMSRSDGDLEGGSLSEDDYDDENLSGEDVETTNDSNASDDEAADDDSSSKEDIPEKEIVHKGLAKLLPGGNMWEDIYGRLRAPDGSIVSEKKEQSESKYIPPALRNKIKDNEPEDKIRQEKLNRLRKQLKGLLNKLAESNMHSIASQIEDLYMNNSRNDMNETLTNLIMESLVSEVIAPERLLIEHVVLLTILHANVGTEVGAHFLQSLVKKLDEHLTGDCEVEDKTLDNIVRITAQLYNFKLFDAKLIYEVLRKLADGFKEKDVECILHVLRSVGFGLRKDDPLALKNLIIDLQNRANKASDEEKDNSRVKFMLDILLAIKNNNVTKIPNYDVSYSEHMKKIMKGFIRKGNYVTMLNISLEDLLKADERGKWWVVGSAWSGKSAESAKSEKVSKTEGFSAKLLELARQQRMNTDIRRNIFCIIMSAEDYLDAFEKLLKLGLKNTQEREIINILLHCCLQEKNYNPYYGYVAQKFCDFDRKYQLTIKYSIWDKLKVIGDHSGSQLSNLAKLLIHLFIEKGLPISILKIVQFSELDKTTLRFMRQILLGILLHKDLEACLSVFARVAHSEKLKLFRESLRLFIHHFLLRNLNTDKIPEDEKSLIESRVKIVENVLTSKKNKAI